MADCGTANGKCRVQGCLALTGKTHQPVVVASRLGEPKRLAEELAMSSLTKECSARITARRSLTFLTGSLLLLAIAGFAPAQDKEKKVLESIKWAEGPTTARLGSIAEIKVPEDYQFAAQDDTIKLMELMQNPTNGDEQGLIMPAGGKWFVLFEYDPTGYVKDDEKNDLNADEMLKSIRMGTEQSNNERRKRGWSTMEIIGWEQRPRYDTETNNLVWAIRGVSEGAPVINYNTRRLGRGGVMSVALVVPPTQLSKTIPTFNDLMKGFSFSAGQRYSEFRSGDKVAEYGLTALVTGGAAAVAVKTGMFKWLWKACVAGVVALGAAIKAIFRRREAA
jgi:uncharacterized membrane-anchored protein